MTCNYRYYKNNDITGLTGSTNGKKSNVYTYCITGIGEMWLGIKDYIYRNS